MAAFQYGDRVISIEGIYAGLFGQVVRASAQRVWVNFDNLSLGPIRVDAIHLSLHRAQCLPGRTQDPEKDRYLN